MKYVLKKINELCKKKSYEKINEFDKYNQVKEKKKRKVGNSCVST